MLWIERGKSESSPTTNSTFATLVVRYDSIEKNILFLNSTSEVWQSFRRPYFESELQYNYI